MKHAQIILEALELVAELKTELIATENKLTDAEDYILTLQNTLDRVKHNIMVPGVDLSISKKIYAYVNTALNPKSVCPECHGTYKVLFEGGSHSCTRCSKKRSNL